MLQNLSIYAKPKILAILLLGFSSGLPLALVFSTLSVWLAEEGVSRTTIGLFAAAGTPYTLKFLWAPLVDHFRLPWLHRVLGRRRSWMMLSQVLLMGAFVVMGGSDPASDPLATAMVAVAIAFLSATQDIVIDAYRVELLEEEDQGAGAAMVVFGYRVGMLVSGAGALFLAEYHGWDAAYMGMALLMLVGFVTVFITGEPAKSLAIEAENALKTAGYSMIGHIKHAVIHPFVNFMERTDWWLILLFIIAYKFGDAFAGVMTNPFFIELGFTKTDIASVNKIFGFVAVVSGAFIGGFIVKYLGLIRSLWVCGILQMLTNLLFVAMANIGYDYPLFVVTIVFENLAGGMGTAAFVAYLSSLCNLQYTATQYALLSSLASVGRTWLSASSGWVVDSIGWQLFFTSTVFAAIPGLLLLLYLSPKRIRR